MANPSEVEAQVRFALSQLPAQNAHHVFEHICRQLTQQFICSNVLPATGPVSAGGDQGRDIETFRTYLREELGPHGAFLGLVSEAHDGASLRGRSFARPKPTVCAPSYEMT